MRKFKAKGLHEKSERCQLETDRQTDPVPVERSAHQSIPTHHLGLWATRIGAHHRGLSNSARVQGRPALAQGRGGDIGDNRQFASRHDARAQSGIGFASGRCSVQMLSVIRHSPGAGSSLNAAWQRRSGHRGCRTRTAPVGSSVSDPPIPLPSPPPPPAPPRPPPSPLLLLPVKPTLCVRVSCSFSRSFVVLFRIMIMLR